MNPRTHRTLWSLSVFAVFVAVLFAPLVAFADGGGGSPADKFSAALAGSGPLVAAGIAFASGLATSATPCVWPMIGITVSVFGAQEAKSRAQGAALSAAFVLGMAVLFTVLGVGAAKSGALFGSLLSNKLVVGFIAAVLLALAASMFGAYELGLPSSLNNRLATVGGIGYGGAFTLGLVTSLIAAPCTGPVMSALLIYIATTGNVVVGSAMMFTFALGLGVPFFLVGTFAVSLPKGGSWMLGVKWFFGVMLTVLALYFLRTAFPSISKLVHRDTTFLFASLALLGIGLVLAGVHVAAERRKSPIAHLSKPMKLTSAPLAIVGGFVLVAWFLTPKAQLQWLESEQLAVQQAHANHRPMIVDFGATWCGACNELATHTFADNQVREEAGRFVAVRVDATDDDNEQVTKIKDKYRVVGLPTVVVLDSTGEEKVRFNEFVPPDRFLSAIKAVN
ncbi:MAG: protein-disulfide reductase DsbD family protein [Polyangiaceae bacterium]